MEIAVIGGAGYLGSVLVAHLLELGHNVTVFDSFKYSANQLLPFCFNQNFNVVNGDVRNVSLLQNTIINKEIIIPLAAMVGQKLCEYSAEEAKSVNVDSIGLLLKLKQPEQKIIFPSTHSCYGNTIGALCDELTAISPLTEYSRTKSQAESLVLKASNTIVLRIGTMFGVSPRMRVELTINNLVYRAVTDKYAMINGSQYRNYIHVRDVVRAIVFAIDHFDTMKGEIYNIGNHNLNLTQENICSIIRKKIPDFIYYDKDDEAPYDKRNYQVSMGKINHLGWRAQIDLETGIDELITAYKMIRPLCFSNY